MSNNISRKDNFIISETFESYKEGAFSEEVSPIRETHFTEKQIHQGPWTVISTYHTDSHPVTNIQWIITKKGNRKVLKQTGINKEGVLNWKYFIKRHILRRNISPLIYFPAIVVGNESWHNYRVDIRLLPFSKKDLCGVLFCSVNGMQHYIYGLKKDKVYLIKRNINSLPKLAVASFDYECGKEIHLSVEKFDDQSNVLLMKRRYFLLMIHPINMENVEFYLIFQLYLSLSPVMMQTSETVEYLDRRQRTIQRAERLKSKYPVMRLIKKVDLPTKCSGRSIRFGDLSGEGQVEYLIVHGIHPKLDSNKTISMTATDSNGRILWQKGEPNRDKTIFPADVPVQIYDIDHDGSNEVICEYGGFFQILDGKTGNVKHQTNSPRLHPDATSALTVLDSIFICNLSGKPVPEDLLVKDMYSNIYAYDCNLNMLWSYQCNTGHYPFTFDLNGDGREDVLIGYTLLSSNGKKIWDLKLRDHADAVAIFKSTKKNRSIVAIAASNEGFIIADTSGRIKKHLRIGHMQTITVANLIPDSQDYQIATNTYWGNPGVIYILDLDGKVLNVFQPSVYGSPLSPVKWTNESTELILLSASKGDEGGMYNGLGQQVVSFPDDGHPYLCYYVYDLDNDGLDEIVCWDHERLWIYESEESGMPNTNRPVRFPLDFNQSNYRSNVSIP